MKRLPLLILSLLICLSVYPVETERAPSIFLYAPSLPNTAPSLRLSAKHDLKCTCHGTQYYEGCYSYELIFETENLDMANARGEGKLMRIMIVMPKKGSKSSVLPLGTFSIGPCDSLQVGSIDFYSSQVDYYGKINDIYYKPDFREAFVQCDINIVRLKGKNYQITLSYELTNGERGEYSFNGKIKLHNDIQRPEFQYMPRKQCVRNWELTKAELSIYDTTVYDSRTAELHFECAEDLFGFVKLYLPLDSVNGRYEIRYGKEPGTCEASRGDVQFESGLVSIGGGIEDFGFGVNYYLVSGYVLITDEKVFMEFQTKDGSTVRFHYYGSLKSSH